MKLPALWLAAAFATGIGVADHWPNSLKVWTPIAMAAMAAGAVLVWRGRRESAWALALIAWAAVGAVATGVDRAGVPKSHVSRLVADGRLDLGEPLRWQGRLREDPLTLPWGRRFEIDLEHVEVAGSMLPVSGGLRLSLYGRADSPDPANGPQGLRAGDRVEALVKARPPRDFQDPGAFDLRGFLSRQRIDLTGSLRSGELLQLIDHPAPTLAQRLARARGDLLHRLDQLSPDHPEHAAVLRAMLLGDRSFVDSQTVTAFQKTAAYHVLVVAGLHVGALVAFLFWLCRRLRLTIGLASVATLGALTAYLGMVQDRPPVLRATLMAAFYLCARPLFRRVDLLNTVALAALVILIWKPSSLADSSFELSFLAAGVIAGLAVPWMERSSAPYRAGLRHLGDVTRDNAHPPKVAQFRIEMRAATHWLAPHLPKILAPRTSSMLVAAVRAGLRLWEVVVLSIVIQWGMTPLLAQDFHRVSLAGPLSNIPAVILTGLIVPLGFLALVATFVWARLAALLGKALGFCTTLLLATVEWFSRLLHVSYRTPGPPVWLIVGFLAAFALLTAFARAAAARRAGPIARRQLPPPIAPVEWASGIVLAVLTILVVSHPFAPRLQRGRLEAAVLDVGQGDSIFAALPNGRTMLIDGGGLPGSEWVGGYRSGTDVGEEVVSPYLWSRGLKQLDIVVLTHADHDHMDGLYAVLENFSVGQLWIGRYDEKPAFRRVLAEARARGVHIVRVSQGAAFDEGGARVEVLWPPEGGGGASSNDNSLVLRLSDGHVRFLLTADIERGAEERLVGEQAPLAADFLKVPHHGSKTSSTDPFLAAVNPRFAAISVSETNSFGQPAASVVERYENRDVRLLRTDRDGAITAITDGKNLAVSQYARP